MSRTSCVSSLSQPLLSKLHILDFDGGHGGRRSHSGIDLFYLFCYSFIHGSYAKLVLEIFMLSHNSLLKKNSLLGENPKTKKIKEANFF